MFLRNGLKSPAEPHGYPTYSLDTNTLSKRQYVVRTVRGTYLKRCLEYLIWIQRPLVGRNRVDV